jgi:hypothetical protein
VDSGEQLGAAEIATAIADLRTAGVDSPTVVLVEGASDKAALRALAQRHGRDLDADGVLVASIGGATNVGRVLASLAGTGVGLAGLCDVGEEGNFARGLERAGLGTGLDRGGMERLGFFVCVEDLEDELIRSLGVELVEAVIESEGELGSLRTLQQMPHQRGKTGEAHLRRFLGTRSGRKIRYGRLLIEALDLSRVPRPLEGVLGSVP